MKVTLKDGVVKEYAEAVSPARIAGDIGAGLAKAACAAVVDGRLRDLRFPIDADAEASIETFDGEGGRKAFWHTSSHIMAQAVKRLYPDAKLAIGPAVANGFYYDFEFSRPMLAEELPAIEEEMKKIAKEELPLEYFELPRAEALKLMGERGEPYKIELINDLPEDAPLSFYKQGDFIDLCAGPHLMTTAPVKAVKLTSVSGSYWRGSEKNQMLTRIYGVSFPKASQLAERLERIEEAKKRDHRKLGRELELFAILEEGQGFPFFLPKGMILKNELINYWREIHKAAGYKEILSPLMLDKALWERSGHWDHYKDNIYITEIEGKEHALKPMNCPGGMLVYGLNTRSYRDLPLRMGELGIVHRHEKSGTLHGLMRVRAFTQDDAHIFMTPEQVKDEIKGVIALIDGVYTKFGFKYYVELSTRPEDSMGAAQDWERAENALKEALGDLNLPYAVNEGDGAFYGPKIDFHLEDSLGRTWQCGTVQLDFQMPERFGLEYVGADGAAHRPVMIHRVVFGSIERFIGILTEHFAGAFPLWLSPVQAAVLPISDKYADYASAVAEKLDTAGIRVETDLRAEKIGFKIREARNGRVPYILVVGEKEAEAGTVSVRSRAGEEGEQPAQPFIDRILKEIKDKA
ncbi:MAG: threonine--tRNA ligase [Clostridiales bacterium]|nr:threonine--tRNA ligase [Clostridiales bacterium]